MAGGRGARSETEQRVTRLPAATVSSTLWRSSGRHSPAVRTSTTSSGAPTSTPISIIVRKIGTSGQRVLIDTSVAVCLKETESGRKARGSRSVDLMIAATALAHRLPLYTLNPKDLRGLESLIEIVDIGS